MFVVYVLYSERFDKIYVGFTSNLEQRLKSHNELGKKGWTIRFRPWTVIYTEQYDDKSIAIKREQQSKSGQGREFIRSLIFKK